ncbi:EamA family transporter RarD [Microbacterium sp. JZ31]|uniref:EamA family transporter RarD n=1 Tax=Microbacterium sp. JZ31 TaxID=1906274 RepID=UPI001EE47035|nr:EamA family transporter RarD [Microbacterium sp. JZ31]
MTQAPSIRSTQGEGAGALYALGAYVLWGILPLYFVALAPTGPWEVVAWRVVLSLVFCAILLTVTRGWGRMIAVLRRPRLALLMGLAGVLIYGNWQVFVIAAQSDQVLEASLGYFINPITTVLLAVLVLHERLRILQWVAIGVAAVAVIVIIVAYGDVPWYALMLTATFGVYGLVKKQVGGTVDATSGLALETLWLTPLAIVQLVIVAATTGLTLGTAGVWHTILLLSAGAVTAVPLLLFAAGSSRVPLATMGMLQFAGPILQFIVGVTILHEPMPASRWIGFGIVWIACILFTVDQVQHARRSRHAPVPIDVGV